MVSEPSPCARSMAIASCSIGVAAAAAASIFVGAPDFRPGDFLTARNMSGLGATHYFKSLPGTEEFALEY
jgi:hypothetical protein